MTAPSPRPPRQLPRRYDTDWEEPFQAQVRAWLRPGARVLDVGSGRRPTVAPADRPPDCFYVGLDLSAAELARAPAGSYHHTVVSDVARPVPQLRESFDLILSWQVLEHVRSLESTLETLRHYLQPGGRLVAFFSGRFSVHGLVNLMIPSPAGERFVSVLMRREPDTVFPAYYDGCYAGALRRMLDGWSAVRLEPHWGAAVYLDRAPTLQRIYVTYEDWARRTRRENLATHYLLAATR